MAESQSFLAAEPKRTVERSNTARPRSLQSDIFSVKTPLLPRRSGMKMESAQTYGSDAEKQALRSAELQTNGWDKESDKYSSHGIAAAAATAPRRRALKWTAAVLALAGTAAAVFNAGHAYDTARSAVKSMAGKHPKMHVLEGILARQSSNTPKNMTNSTLPYGTLVPRALTPLPLGSIKPQGWLLGEMEGLRDGLAGHEHDFFTPVSDSLWTGGSTDYSILYEGLPYWLNGIVPLAYALGDQNLISTAQAAVKYIAANQNATDGWVGPRYFHDARDIWSKYPLFLGMRNMADADSSMTQLILGVLYKFIPNASNVLMDGSLAANHEDWARSRYADMVLTLQWLFDKHPVYNGTDQRGLLWQMMGRLKSTGIDWAGYYTEQSYLFQDIDTVRANTEDGGDLFPFLHGVNVGQGLKTMAVDYLFTHNASLLTTQKNAVDWTMKYHGAASGTIIGDERESSLAPNRGSELCTAVETMFSMHTVYSITGQNEYADRAELAAFNALPVMLTGDQWAHQYITQPNQPWSSPVDGGAVFWNVGDYGITYGTAPNYQCCTVNHPQGWPKFTSASYMAVGWDGIAHVLLAPASVSTQLTNGANVAINAITDYPFSDLLTYEISTNLPFTFYVRVPGWSQQPTLTINGQPMPVLANQQSGLAPVFVQPGTSTVQLVLKSTMYTAERANDTVALYRGALLYALDVGQVNTSTVGNVDVTRLPPPTSDPSIQEALQFFPNQTSQDVSVPAQARDYNISNTLPWNYAIDVSTLKFFAYNGSGNGDLANVSGTVLQRGETVTGDATGHTPSLPTPIFDYAAPSQYITALACEISWPLLGGMPFRPPLKPYRECISQPVQVVFRPYGAVKLHMAELPTVDLGITNNSTRNATGSR